MSVSITEQQVFTALWNFLTLILPANVAVVQGQANMVAEPAVPDFVVMTPLLRERLSTNQDTFQPSPLPAPALGQTTALAPTKITYQLDVHGPNSADNAQTISTLLRDDYAVQSFINSGLGDITPLHASDPSQQPFTNAEGQYETRWIVEAVLQANIAVTVPQDYATALKVTLEEQT